MYLYKIPMKFKCSNVKVYSQFEPDFMLAQEQFNLLASKRQKPRKIRSISYEEDGFVIFLESHSQLQAPSKALAIFSQNLAKMPKYKDYLDKQNHLLQNNGPAIEIRDVEVEPTTKPSELVKIAIDILLTEDINDSAFKKAERKKAREVITKACQDFALVE